MLHFYSPKLQSQHRLACSDYNARISETPSPVAAPAQRIQSHSAEHQQHHANSSTSTRHIIVQQPAAHAETSRLQLDHEPMDSNSVSELLDYD